MKARCLIVFVSFLLPLSISAETAVYSDSLKNHYPVEGKAFDLGSYSLEIPVVAWDDSRKRSATVVRTRGDAYPYERQKGFVTIEGEGLEESRVLSVSHFRTIDVSWVTEKLILIRIGVGRVAAVEAIYDVIASEWIYRESVQYIEEGEIRGQGANP